MKPFNTLVSVKSLALLALLTLVNLGMTVSAQQKTPLITARFANPQFDQDAQLYYLDVELNSATSKEILFGLNARFFYDATMLEFVGFDQFGAGYGLLLDEKPVVHRGNEDSGSKMFNISGPATYVAGSVQMRDELFPVYISPDSWTKVMRATFKVPQSQREGNFCPAIVWDIKPQVGVGGFLPGSDGLLVTVAENDPSTKTVSLPSIAKGEYFNWEFTQADALPYGRQVKGECISLGQTVATEDPGTVDAKGYALFQNSPNPFQDKTVIEFIVPVSQDASIKLYDGSGKILDEIKGHYKAGKNSVSLERKPWMEQSGVVLYQLEAEGHKSETLTMTLVQR
jgi:hypothetical protein